MKILAIILLCLMVLMAGCSHSHNSSSALWKERQMDDNQRIHGSPYESPNQSTENLQGVWLSAPF
jgi:hypothetical protein